MDSFKITYSPDRAWKLSVSVLTLWLIVGTTLMYAQPPLKLWSKTYGGSQADKAYDVQVLSDGGYVLCGSSTSADGQVGANYGGSDAWVVRTDANGNLLWQKNYGGSADDLFKAVHVMNNGDFVFCGATASVDGDVPATKGGLDFWIVRTDPMGNLIWSYTYGGSGDEVANDLAPSGDTAFIAVGFTYSNDGDVYDYKAAGDAWLLYFDYNGMMVSQKTKGGSAYDEFLSINSTANGGFILCGLSYSNDGTVSGNQGGADAWIARLSKHGNELWNFLYGTSADDLGHYIAENDIGHFILAGSSSLNGNHDYWYVSVDDQGSVLNSATYGGTDFDQGVACFTPETNSVILFGTSASPSDAFKDCALGQADIWILKTIENSLSWQMCLGGSGNDYVSGSLRHSPQYLVHAGYTNSIDQDISDHKGDYDFWLVKLADGCDVQANFSYSPLGGGVIQFENSSYSAYSYLWHFGDGNISTEEAPTHSYSAAGTYQVCLIAISACTADTLCMPITVVCDSALAGFTYVTNNLKVLFTGSGTNVASWSWNFGDGNAATGNSVSHTYAAPGTYYVCVTGSNFCSSNTFCQLITVDCPPVVAGFSWSANNLTVTFTSTSTNASKWKWKFGNGQNSSQENPVVTYSAAGTYEVCLIAGNDCYSDTLCQFVTVTCALPTPAFSYSATNLTVIFNNATANATSWFWEFGDGNSSTLQHPQHAYASAGTYEVCLTASNSCGSATTCSLITITCPLPLVSFSYQANNLQVAFLNNTTAADTYLWDFGDGTTSTAANPQHTYSSEGSYLVCLTATNSCGNSTACTTVTISCQQAVAAFNYVTNNLSVTFTNNSANATGYLWTFGDGNSSSATAPTHTYATAGTYQVCLTSYNDCSQSTSCQNVAVSCPPFSAAFTYEINELTVQFFDQSANSISWLWNFGDGNSSTLQNPVHIYATPGIYLVCLTASDGCTEQQWCDSVVIIGVTVPTIKPFISVYPHPFRDYTIITAQKLPSRLILKNAAGIILRDVDFVVSADGRILLQSKGLPAGWYLLEWHEGASVWRIPVLVQ